MIERINKIKLEDIKKMSDEEFIEYVKGLIDKKYSVISITGNKREISYTQMSKFRRLEDILSKNFFGSLFSVFGAMGFTFLFTNTDYISEESEKLISIAVAGLLYGVGYSLEKKKL